MQKMKAEAEGLLAEILCAAAYCGALFALIVLIVR